MKSYVTFKISEQQFAVDVQRVKEIIPYREPSHLPQSPKYVEGMIDLRGSVVTVIDPKAAMGIFCDYPYRYIAIIELSDFVVGISINDLGGIVDVEDSNHYDLNRLLGHARDPQIERMVMGIAKDGDLLYRVFDLDSIEKMLI